MLGTEVEAQPERSCIPQICHKFSTPFRRHITVSAFIASSDQRCMPNVRTTKWGLKFFRAHSLRALSLRSR
jgi:hypothetical protein